VPGADDRAARLIESKEDGTMRHEPGGGPSTEKSLGPIVSRDGGPAMPGLMKRDWLVALVFFAVGLSAVILVTRAQRTAIADKVMTWRWFEADCPEILASMSDRSADNQKVKLHPIFPLMTYPVITAITWIGHVSPLEAVWLLNAATAGVWLGTLYLVMRLLDCRLLDSLLFTCLAASSGAATFWFFVPETYPLGSLTILLALGLVALARHRRVPDWWFVVASAGSLTITVTNWIAGLIGTFVSRPPRRAAVLSAGALAVVLGLLFVEKATFPRADSWFISPRGYSRHKLYFLCGEQGGALNAARVIYLTSAVVPRIELSTWVSQQTPHGPMLTIQRAPAGSSGVIGLVATITWGLLLAAGAMALVAGRGDVRFRIALAVTILGETVVYLIYGEETFLYALNCVPLLILAVALATLSRWRYVVVAATALLLPCAAWNNISQLRAALDIPVQAPRIGARLDPRPQLPLTIGAAASESADHSCRVCSHEEQMDAQATSPPLALARR